MANTNIQIKNGSENIYPIPYYPIGAVYMSYDSTSPATLFGGTWAQLKGAFLYAGTASNTVKQGEATHKLTVNEMPSHIHKIIGRQGSGTATSTTVIESYNCSSSGTGYFGDTGSSQAHNNMPPYLAVYMWRKVGDHLSLSKDTDGTTIYNNRGYKRASRVNSSGNIVDITNPNCDTPPFATGFIPCKTGSLVILNNCYIYAFNGGAESTLGVKYGSVGGYGLRCGLYNSSKTLITTFNWANFRDNDTTNVSDGTGSATDRKVTQFTINTANVAYIRLCLASDTNNPSAAQVSVF